MYPISCGFKTFFAAKIPYWLGSSTTTQVARIKSTKPVKRPHHKANGEPSPAASAGLPSNNPTSIGVSVGSPAGSLDVDWDFEPTKTATTEVIGQEDPSKRSGKILLDPTWNRESIDTVGFTSNGIGILVSLHVLECVSSYALNGIVFQIPCTHYGRTSTGWLKKPEIYSCGSELLPQIDQTEHSYFNGWDHPSKW